MSAHVVTCPSCGGNNLDGERRGTTIRVSCRDCAEEWDRAPAPVCPRCASTEIVTDTWDSSCWDDIDAGTWWNTAETDLRCVKCNYTWHTSDRVESGSDTCTAEDLRDWTVAELREQVTQWGLDTTGLRKAELISTILREQDNDDWSEDQLLRMPKTTLNEVARGYGVRVKQRSREAITRLILDAQQEEFNANED